MNIPCAFIMGTKIKEIEVPAEGWTKVTTIPVVNPDPEYAPTVLKSAGVHGDKIYEVDGNNVYGYTGDIPPAITVRVFDGSTWSNQYSLQTADYYNYQWQFAAGNSMFVECGGNLYLFNVVNSRFSIWGQTFCFKFDGTSWQQISPSGGWAEGTLSSVAVKDNKIYLFLLSYSSYFYDVYEYSPNTNTIVSVVSHALSDYVDVIHNGFRQIVYFNNKFYCIGISGSDKGYVHVVNPDTWQVESSVKVTQYQNDELIELIVYKNALHAFGTDADSVSHYVYNSVNNTWNRVEDVPYQRNPNQAIDKYTKAIIYKNKLHTIGVQNSGAIPYPNSTSYDDMYKYNR